MSSFQRQEQLLEDEAGNGSTVAAVAGIHDGLEESTASTSKSTNILYYIGPALLAGFVVPTYVFVVIKTLFLNTYFNCCLEQDYCEGI